MLATGRLENAISFNCVVDWLSPTKVRQTRVLGERGMLVADTLTADLTFYENGDVASEWAEHPVAARRLGGRRDALRAGPPRAAAGRARGVLRPARRRRAARRWSRSRRAWRPCSSPRRRCASARAGETGCSSRRPREGGRRRAGQDRPAARHPDRPRRPRGDRLRHRRGRGRPRQRRAAAVPRRGRARRGAGRGRRRRAPARDDRHHRRRSPSGADLVVAVPPLVVDADARPDWRHARRGAGRHRRRPAGGHHGGGRDDAAGRHDPQPRRARRSARHSGLRAEDEFFCVFSPERVYSGRVFRDLATYPKLARRAQRGRRGARRQALPQLPGRRGVAAWARPRPPS